MLHPSYSELIDILNSETDTDNQITSRYTIVIAAAKRARQLIDGSPTATGRPYNDKAVSTAVTEMKNGKIKIMLSAQAQQENREFDADIENIGHRRDDKIAAAALAHILVDDDDEDDIEEFDDFDEEIDMQADSELLKSLGLTDDLDGELDDEGIEKISLDEEFEKEMFDEELEDDLFDDDDTYGD